MKKSTILLTAFSAALLIGLLGFIVAEGLVCTQEAKLCPDGSYVSRNSNNGCKFDACPDDEQLVGASCGTVTPGYQNECCVNKGYSGWDAEEFECVNENENEEDENETENHILGTALGASCGTVTPGYQNECCERKGYDSWDQEEFKCIGEIEDDERDERVGVSCGTVTPGMENECCERKGYNYGWNREEFECMDKNESEDNENECEDWNCTRWSECSDGIRTRECVKSQLNCTEEDDEDEANDTEEQPKLTRYCYEKKELIPHERTIDCPEECVCSGSTIKCSFENGTRVMTVYAGKSGNLIVQIKNLNMSTNVTLYKGENGKVYGVFKGNKTHEVILPDEVMEKLKERHEKRLQLYNESINLTEDGYYQVQTKKRARLFWLVPVKEHMRAEVNAETGEIIKIRNPWWGFLARDMRE